MCHHAEELEGVVLNLQLVATGRVVLRAVNSFSEVGDAFGTANGRYRRCCLIIPTLPRSHPHAHAHHSGYHHTEQTAYEWLAHNQADDDAEDGNNSGGDEGNGRLHG